MKKFFGALLVPVGTALVIFFGSLIAVLGENPFFPPRLRPVYTALYAGIAILGVVAIVCGIMLYRADGESPKTKLMVGRLMMLVGLALVIFGACFAFVWRVLDHSPVWVLGAGSLVAGLIYLITGKAKAKTGRKASLSVQTVNRRTDHSQRSESEKKEEVVPPPKPKMMVCEECGKTYPLGQVYCDECGSLLKETQRG